MQSPEFNRKAGRLRIEGVTCNRGKIIDLSRTGCQLLVKKRWRRDECRTLVFTGSRVRVTVSGQCRRIRKVGFMRYAIGLMFIETDDAVDAALTELVRSHCSFLDEPESIVKKRRAS